MPVLARKKAVIFLALLRKSYSVGLGGDLLLLIAVMVWMPGEGCKSFIREAAEAVWDRRCFALDEGPAPVPEMAEGCPDSEEEKNPQAAAEGPASTEPVYQNFGQESWYVPSINLFSAVASSCFLIRLVDL